MARKNRLIFVIAFLATACSGQVNPADFMLGDFVSLATPTATAAAIETAAPVPTTTVTEAPTPTVGYQETAIVAQQTANAAMELMVDVTAARDRENFQQLAFTVTAEWMLYQNDQLTQSASAVTASAYPTAIPLTQTQQSVINNFRATEQQMTLTAPTQIYVMAQSETYAKNSDRILVVELGLKIAISVFLIVLALYVILRAIQVVLMLADQPEIKIPDLNDQPMIIPFKTEKTSGGVVMKRAEILCSNEQLLEFADGILNHHMTPAFGLWEGTKVHRNLKYIREFLEEHKFAKLIPRSGGALDIQADGESFLRHCLDFGTPPPPYQCIG